MKKLKGLFAIIACIFGGLTFVLAAIFTLGAQPVQAGTGHAQAELQVCASGCPYTTLQDAVNAANPGDTIKVAGGEYDDVFTYNNLKQIVYITESLTILGGYAPPDWTTADPQANPTVLDAESGGRGIVIWGSITVHIEGLEITGGNADNLGGCLYGIEPKNPAGGGIYIRDATVTISNTLVEDSVAAVTKNSQGCGGGIYAQSANLAIFSSTLQNNHSSTGAAGLSNGGGLMTVFGILHMEECQVQNNTSGYSGYAGEGGGVRVDSATTATFIDNLVSGNTTQASGGTGDGAGMQLKATTVTLAGNRITNNTALHGASTGGGLSCFGACTLIGNLVAGNTANYGAGAYLTGSSIKLENNVFMENIAKPGGWGSAFEIWNATVTMLHNTLAGNTGGDGSAIFLYKTHAQATNTLIADSPIGVYKDSGAYNVSLDHTLWSNVITSTFNAGSGTLANLNPLTGAAGFDTDGYHLTRYSAALGAGQPTALLTDFDGEVRPLPAGTLPDIGVDELDFAPGAEFIAEKVAFAPQWVADASNPAGSLHQRYLLRFFYGSPEPNPPALTVTITDTLPISVVYQSDIRTPTMTLSQQGQQFTWQTAAPVARGQSGEVVLDTLYDKPVPGQSFTNTAIIHAGDLHFDLKTTTQALVIAPLISTPGSGEACTGTLDIEGMAQPGVTVTLYANDLPIATIPTNEQGIFIYTYDYPGGNVTLKAQACSGSGICSPFSDSVELKTTESFWCPQRSTWTHGKNVFRFRDASGKFSTTNWAIPGYYGFSSTHLDLYVCDCPGSDEPPTDVWVEADGSIYEGVKEEPWYHFYIGQAHSVEFHAQCSGGTEIEPSFGAVLIDPDGYIFDVDLGFDPVNPTLHAIAGVTVTAYVSMPGWGGWVPWPAHLYEEQVNPQVTGADGYFAFFTPPGFYYLQVQGKPGYQSWRSPVIQVINEIVHVNVPLTPWGNGTNQVALTLTGPEPLVITLPVGSAVTWLATVSQEASGEELIRWIDNPTLHLLSARNPLSDTLGFDAGMLIPGQGFTRFFTTPGTYTYSDGTGHTGQVVVSSGTYYIFLPLVRR